jgi:hypothetical protein
MKTVIKLALSNDGIAKRLERNSKSYMLTVSTSSDSDILLLDRIRARVKQINKNLREADVKTGSGESLQYYINCRGRVPLSKKINQQTGAEYSYNYSGSIVGGLKNASRMDVYLYER